MGIESNKEAMAMMKNALGSIENRFREAYNKGYKDGLRDGASQVTAKLVSKMLEEIEADTSQTDLLVKTPHKSRESHEKNCETCRDKDAYDEWQGNCDECVNGSMYTPQTNVPDIYVGKNEEQTERSSE